MFATLERALSDGTRRAIWDDPRGVIANGPPIEAAAEPRGGGHVLTGRWWFSSGLPHATWLAALAPVEDGADGETRLFLLPKADADLPDTWHVAGLRGTGSHEFRVSQLFVPVERSFVSGAPRPPARPLHAIPTSLLFAGGFAAVALGVARAALDFALTLAEGKAQRFQWRALRDQGWVQDHVGRAETHWRAADVFLHTTVAERWESAIADWQLSQHELALLRMAATDAIRQASEVVDLAYNVVGTDGIFQDRGFQRRYQDMHVITQQVQARTTHYEALGRFFWAWASTRTRSEDRKRCARHARTAVTERSSRLQRAREPAASERDPRVTRPRPRRPGPPIALAESISGGGRPGGEVIRGYASR